MADPIVDPIVPPVDPQPDKSDLIPRAEAKKAFDARDKAKKEADELRRWKDEREAADQDREAKAEEDRLKKAGEWEAIKQTLVAKHTAELETERTTRTALESRYTKEKIESAFHAAPEWFGPGGKTILSGAMGYKVLNEYVAFEDVEIGDTVVKAVVVRDPDGNLIVDGKGNPAKFAEAIGELIAQLPDRDNILRGSGKTGSGSSGGSHANNPPVDLRNLTPARLKDPRVIAALEAQRPTNAIQMGSSFSK